MLTLETLRSEKREQLMRIARGHGAQSVAVFGSVARGEAREGSDLDLLVEFEPGRSLFDHISLQLDLEDLLGEKVGIVTPGSLRYLRQAILEEAVPL